jgi:1-acyl-sn-glycerol-3-phosphate acyltransferase
MAQINLVSQASLTDKETTAAESGINHWLTPLVYPLGSYIVLPTFFKKLVITGQENIPTNDPVIVAPTHRSRWDALVVPTAVGKLASGREVRFMVSANEMKGLQGWAIRRLGGFPVNTRRPGLSSLIKSVELLSQGEMVVIFPEGGIFRDRIVHPLKPGVARIALEVVKQQPDSQVKILPVSVRYNQEIPTWGAEVQVDIGKPLTVAPYLCEPIKEATETLTSALSDSLKALHEGD